MAAEYEGVSVQVLSVTQQDFDVTSCTELDILERQYVFTGLGKNARSLRSICSGSIGDQTARRRRCNNHFQVVGIASPPGVNAVV